MNFGRLKQELKRSGTKARAAAAQRYFKTGPGEYGEGDIFRGLTVPQCRMLSRKYRDLGLSEIQKLIASKYHEDRLISLFILVLQYENGDAKERNRIFRFYTRNMKQINNWDLVDSSAPHILGRHLFGKDRALLYRLAKSPNLWRRRISIISTFYFIRQGQFQDALRIAKILVNDEHDLIHKAVGWMLREIGKKDQKVETKFLDENSSQMPRTMLRYAIERFPENKRQRYLNS